MKTATVSEFRNHAKGYFDQVEKGETVQVFRNGKAVAVIAPYVLEGRLRRVDPAFAKAYWKSVKPIPELKGVDLTGILLDERKQARW